MIQFFKELKLGIFKLSNDNLKITIVRNFEEPLSDIFYEPFSGKFMGIII